MRACDDCTNVAQWAMSWVRRFPHTEEEKKKKLIPKGPELIPAGFFCTAHKEKLAQLPSELERSFRFVGVAVGSHNS
jgi:hypothetical protein